MGVEEQIWVLRAVIVAATAGMVLVWWHDRHAQQTEAQQAEYWESQMRRRDTGDDRSPGRGRPVLRTGAVLERPAVRR